MKNTRRRAIVTLFTVLGLIAAACGDSSDSDTADTTAATTTEAPDTTVAPSTTAEPGTTAATTEPEPTRRELLVIGVPTEPDSLDENIGEVRWEGAQTTDAVIRRTPEGELLPSLATEWSSNDDATVWTVTLRDGVTWHDGTPFTAQDLVDTAEYIVGIDAIQEIRGSAGFTTYESSRAIDDLTFEITYSAPAVLWPINMAYWRVQKVTDNMDSQPVGTGPYKFVSWDRGSKVTLEANDDYWGDPPKVQNVEFVVIPDAAARVAALEAGEVDVINPVIVEDAPRLPNIYGASEPIQFYRFVLNSREGVTADKRVRQAMNLALDKDAMNEAFFGGLGIIDQCQSLLPSHIGFNEDLEAYPYDPERAKELIAEAGAEGAELTFMGAADRWAKMDEVMEVSANYWAEIGLNVTLDIVPFQEWLDRAFVQPGPRPDLYFVGASIRTFDGQSLENYLLSPAFETARTSSVSDPFFDEKLPAAKAIFDLEERDAAFEEIGAHLCDEATFVFTFAVPDFYGAAEDITFNPDPRLRWTRVDDMTFG